MLALKLIPAWAWIALAAIIAVGMQQYRINSISTDFAEYRSEVDKQRAAIAEAARIEERRRQHIAEKEIEYAKTQQHIAENDAAKSSAAADSLRKQLAGLRDRLANRDAAIAGERKANSSAIGVLADLLSESVERNRVLAEALDRSRIAGMTCERMYNGMNRYGR